MIHIADALRLIGERRGDAPVVSTMTGTQGWNEVTLNEAMGLPMDGTSIKTVPVMDLVPLPQRGPWRRTPKAMQMMSEALRR